MSASSLPNLLAQRGTRGGRGFRRSRGGGGHSSGVDHDTTIQNTDVDAAVSRLSAVELGYLDDPYAQYFVQSSQGQPNRRLPIINRGEDLASLVRGVAHPFQVLTLGHRRWTLSSPRSSRPPTPQ